MSISRDEDRGQFVFEFDRTIEGKRVRLRKRLPKTWTRTQADAFDRKEGARLYAVATGIARDRALIDDAIDLYLEDKKHLKTYNEVARQFAYLFHYYEGRYMDELPEVAAEITEKEAGINAPATIKLEIALLRAACKWAWKKHKLGEHDPGARVIVPQVRNERHVYITFKQLLKQMRYCRHPEARKALATGFFTGMRLSEILRAEMDGEFFVVYDLKNGSAVKKVPIHPLLKRYLRRGWPIQCAKSTVQKYARASRDKAGMPEVTFHTTRHSAASELINAGVDLFTVGSVLGHKDPRSTKRYAHLQQESLVAAIGKMVKRA